MCLIAFAIDASARWPLLIASNRDEALARPTAPLAAWISPAGNTILSGRDLRDGGAWLGVSSRRRVAMLTNVRIGPSGPGSRSRGGLVTGWLDAQSGIDELCEAMQLRQNAADYGGFNLVTGDLATGQWHWVTNTWQGSLGALHIAALLQGVYGLSNAGLDTPWPKTLKLKQALTDQLNAPDFESLVQAMLPALQDRCAAPAELLPHTGIGVEREVALSSPFVSLPGYGTRCSAVIALAAPDATQTQQLNFAELTYGEAFTGSATTLPTAQRRNEQLRW